MATPTDQLLRVGRRLRELREQRGLSAADLGRALNMQRGTISRYELGERDMGLAGMLRAAEVLRCEPGDFFRNEEPETERVAVGRVARQPDDYAAPPHLYPMRDALRGMGIPEETTAALLTITDALARRNGA